MKAGTALTLANKSTTELHEMVILQIPDDERRSIDVLARLPVERTRCGVQRVAGCSDHPGARREQINAVGDGKLTEKGRYAVICPIPTGADPRPT